MKFKSFVYAAMATFLFAACSDSEQLDGTQTATTTERLASGYLAVQINLPTEPSSRADNDKFDDGTANEYAVNSGALLLFSGANEKTATFKAAYDLSLQDYWISAPDKTDDNITTSNLVAVQVSNPAEATEKLYGLVMLNYTGVAKIVNNELTLTGNTEAFEGTFADFVATTSKASFYTVSGSEATGFFMINAPISSVNDGDVAPELEKVTTLVDITGGIKPTKADAESAPAGSFFVERAVAKATLSFSKDVVSLGDNEMVDKEGQPVTFSVGDVEWTLNATNESSYIVRNMYGGKDAVDFLGYKAPGRTYRMVGKAKIGTTIIQPAVDYYRTYWCYDPTYTTGEGLSYKDNGADDFVTAGTTPLYCYENTFDVEHQTHQNTTQALIKVTLKLNGEASTFYTINDREDVIYASKDDATAYSINYILHDAAILEAIENALKGSGKKISLSLDGENGEKYTDYLNIEIARADDGYLKVTEVKFNNKAFTDLEGVAVPVWTDKNSEDLCTVVNELYRIAEYEGGVSYYPVRFKHFAGTGTTDLAPWDPSKVGISSYDYDTYTGIKDGGSENMWLGRYGMVRNNWYDVTVTALKHLGKPSIEGLEVGSDPTPDDEVEEWIAFKINILSWAKRTQSVTL